MASKMGIRTLLLERGSHPRFAIGESSTPLANLLLEEIAKQFLLPELATFSKWGSWQQSHPEVPCGLKRGFTFLKHDLGKHWKFETDRRNELLVAASPYDRIADTHWLRAPLDAWLFGYAAAQGTEVRDGVRVEVVEERSDGMRLQGVVDGEPFAVRTAFLVDATGPRGCLHRLWKWEESTFPNLNPTETLFAHFRGVKRLGEMREFEPGTCTEGRPYPIDDAAVHHVLDSGWIWVLRFNEGTVSAGVAMKSDRAQHYRFYRGAMAWEELLADYPSIQSQFSKAKPVTNFVHWPKLSYRSPFGGGNRWVLLPSAAGFIDPLLSTGFPLALLGVIRLGTIFKQSLHDWAGESMKTAIQHYSKQMDSELLSTENLISALYAGMSDFEVFVELSKLYFAAASYSETQRRLGSPETVSSFLLSNRLDFDAGMRDVCDHVRQVSRSGLMEQWHRDIIRSKIESVIKNYDVAGFTRADRRRWYPVDLQDLFGAAERLGTDLEAIRTMLQRCGAM